MFVVNISDKQNINKFLARFFLDLIPKFSKNLNFDQNLNFFIKIPLAIFKELDILLSLKEFNFINDLEINIEFYTKKNQKLTKKNNLYKLLPLFWING